MYQLLRDYLNVVKHYDIFSIILLAKLFIIRGFEIDSSVLQWTVLIGCVLTCAVCPMIFKCHNPNIIMWVLAFLLSLTWTVFNFIRFVFRLADNSMNNIAFGRLARRDINITKKFSNVCMFAYRHVTDSYKERFDIDSFYPVKLWSRIKLNTTLSPVFRHNMTFRDILHSETFDLQITVLGISIIVRNITHDSFYDAISIIMRPINEPDDERIVTGYAEVSFARNITAQILPRELSFDNIITRATLGELIDMIPDRA